MYDSDYYFDQYNNVRYKKKKPNRAFLLIFGILIISLLSGLAGGWAVYGALDRRGEPQRNGGTVILQTVPKAEPKAAESLRYDSLVEEIAAKSAPCVVEVNAGSGVIASAEGYIITNNHVVEGADSISVRTREGDIYDAAFVGLDPLTDLAVIKVEADGLPQITFADSDAAKVGETTVAIGNSLGTLGGSVTEGILSAKDREIVLGGQAMVLLQTSAAVSPGNSGGGLFDREGYLLGIVNARSGEKNAEGIGFAIPSNTVKKVVAELITHGYITGRPALGVKALQASSRETMLRHRLNKGGVYVQDAPERSGLRQWDRVLSVDGVEITSVSEIKGVVSRYAVGDTLEVLVERESQMTAVSVVLVKQGSKPGKNEV